jgi:HTH-type transcriptional regulator, competence development regulator
MENFGETIRNLREEKGLQLRKVAAYLDIDQAVLSKFEHGTRTPKREQVIQLAKFFKVDQKQMLVKWLASKVVYEMDGEGELALQAMMVAEEQIKYNRKKK